MMLVSSSFLPKGFHSHPINISSFSAHNIAKTSNLCRFSQPMKKSKSKTPQTTWASNNTINHSSSSSLAIILKKIDDYISKFLDLPLNPGIDPNHVLSGEFTPVDELPPTPCEVAEGLLPDSPDGAYIRNGPNPQFIPKGPYHLFDGDGMLHMITISRGKATFCSRYVKTYKYMVEREIGYPIVPSVFASFNNGIAASIARCILTVARILAHQFNPISHGFGTANTSLAFFSGRLFALCESDLPYEVALTSNGDIITIGRDNFHSYEPFVRMTAHPKIDQQTGEAFAYSFNGVRPFLTFFIINPDGRKQRGVPIYSVKETVAIHDFAVTKSYAIFPDVQMSISPLRILGGMSPVKIDPSKMPRLGIIPRYAKDEKEMWWIDAPDFNMFHCWNAWEEDGGNTITIIASNIASMKNLLKEIDLPQFVFEKIIINVQTKTMHRHPLSPKSLELAAINPHYTMKKNRYVYVAMIKGRRALGIVKLDLSLSNTEGFDCEVGSRHYMEGWCGGEMCFVAREANNPAAEEDDGYLVTYIHHERKTEAKLLVMDAKSPTLDIVTVVNLPRWIPVGFHGIFLPNAVVNLH